MEASLTDKEEYIKGMTKKTFQKLVMPPVGANIYGSKVIYINHGKLRFTAGTNTTLPEIGMIMEWKDRAYKICHINKQKNRFSAEFIGFKKPIERPVNDNTTAKLLDDNEIDDDVATEDTIAD
jgi:hypothetical protein